MPEGWELHCWGPHHGSGQEIVCAILRRPCLPLPMRSILLLQLVEFAARLRYVPVVVRDFREFGLSSNREAFELVEKKLEQIHSKNFRGWSFRWQRNRLRWPPKIGPVVKR